MELVVNDLFYSDFFFAQLGKYSVEKKELAQI